MQPRYNKLPVYYIFCPAAYYYVVFIYLVDDTFLVLYVWYEIVKPKLLLWKHMG